MSGQHVECVAGGQQVLGPARSNASQLRNGEAKISMTSSGILGNMESTALHRVKTSTSNLADGRGFTPPLRAHRSQPVRVGTVRLGY